MQISVKYVFNFSTNFYSYIKRDVRLSKTLKLNFILMFFDTAYLARPLALWRSMQFKPLSYYWRDYSNGLGSYLLLYSMAIFETEYLFHFVSANLPFYLVQLTPDSHSYYLMAAIAKIPKICKRTSLAVYISIWKSQDCATNSLKI